MTGKNESEAAAQAVNQVRIKNGKRVNDQTRMS
jgi:hypothetical protein